MRITLPIYLEVYFDLYSFKKPPLYFRATMDLCHESRKGQLPDDAVEDEVLATLEGSGGGVGFGVRDAVDGAGVAVVI